MKACFDYVFATILFILLLPVFLVVMALIKIKMGSPVFFRQVRPGLHGKPFEVRKFRTMTLVKDEHQQYLPDAQRLTGLGQFLRKSSLDELPQLLNILRGDMSFVGPRPLLCEYLPLYNEEQAKRHEVKPGITGWAQVNGRNSISWEDKFRLDCWYVEHQTFLLDLKILGLTVFKVFKSEGINEREGATMSKFQGNRHE